MVRHIYNKRNPLINAILGESVDQRYAEITEDSIRSNSFPALHKFLKECDNPREIIITTDYFQGTPNTEFENWGNREFEKFMEELSNSPKLQNINNLEIHIPGINYKAIMKFGYEKPAIIKVIEKSNLNALTISNKDYTFDGEPYDNLKSFICSKDPDIISALLSLNKPVTYNGREISPESVKDPKDDKNLMKHRGFVRKRAASAKDDSAISR